MATISELNVRLGLLYKDFDKSLTAVEKRLERSGRKFSQLGNDLTLAISAPLAALGVSAIKQAGEIEALKLAMTSTFETAGRSAEDAAKEVEALRISAKAPGLDFEQAIKGSIRLQGVGIAAENARKILEEMANAIALTGGTAEDLDGVTRQFSQMIAKGRVLQEDVSIIAERMPKISGLMQDAFGTASVEAIRKSGVTAQEFVDKITAAAAALPRVEGGIKNALVNAGAEARSSLAKLGEAINKAFNIPETLDMLTKKLASAVEWFDSLDDSTKRNIVTTGAFLVAAGPVVKILGAMYGGIAQAVGGFKLLANATKPAILLLSSMTQSTQSLPSFFGSFAQSMLGAGQAALKMRVAVIAATGGLAAIVLGIAGAVYLLSDRFDEAEFAAKAFSEAQADVTKEAGKEVGQLNKNIDVLKDVRSTTDERRAAINNLLAAYPTYFKGMDLEHASLARLNSIQKELTSNVIRGIAERKKADAVNKIYEKQAETLLRIQEIRRTGEVTAGESTLVNTGDSIAAGFSIAEAVARKLEQRVKDLGEQANVTAKDFDKAFNLESRDLNIDPALNEMYRAREAAEEARDAFLGFGDEADKAKNKIAGTGAATGAAADKAEKMANAYKKAVASIEAVGTKGDILGSEILREKAKEVENQMERLVEMGFGPNSKPIQNLRKYLTDIRAEISKGFGSPNATQSAVGSSPAAPSALPSLALPQSVKLDTSGLDSGIQKAKELGASVDSVADAFGRLNSQVSSTAVQLGSTWADMKTGAMSFGEAITASAKVVQEKYGEIGNAIYGQVSEIANGILAIQSNNAEQEKARLDEQYASRIEAAQGSASAVAAIEEELAQKKADIDKKVGKAKQRVAILQAIINTAQGVTSALGSAPPPYNFILAALTAAAGAVQIGVIKSQSFASGGVVSKPTYALMGEYPDASTNPEIISPEKKLRAVFRDEIGMNNAGPTELYSVIRGDDILLISDKAAQRRGRIG